MRHDLENLWHRLNSTGYFFFYMFLAAVFMFISLLYIKNPVLPKTIAYGFIREAAKKSLEMQTSGWMIMKGEHFFVKYTKQDKNIAPLVLQTAEDAVRPVNKMFGYEHQGPIPIVIYPSRHLLGKSFGWDADESAMGVYWAGVIRVLSPNVWIEGEDKAGYFKRNGPMVHEYVHLIIDYVTRGNYPRWFSEGIAQMVEREITGFEFAPVSPREEWYTLKELDKEFDNLSDQSLAYGQSLAMVDYIIEIYGWETVLGIMDKLGEGKIRAKDIVVELGTDDKSFEKAFSQWMMTAKEEVL